MTAPPAQAHWPTLAAAIAAISTVGTGLSLSIPLLSLRMEHAGFSARDIGVNTALGAIATLAFAPFVPRAARYFGVKPLMLAALALGFACLLAFGSTDDFTLWYPLRLLFGASLTVMFVMSEYWINAAAPPERRGLVMGIYATGLALGFAVGPAVLGMTGTDGLLPFAVGAGLFIVAAIPVMLAGNRAPALEGRGKIRLAAFLTAAPAATLAAFTFGAIETGGMSLLPVYAVRLNFTLSEAALCVSLFALGSVLLELPMGYLSDRIDRRALLFWVAVAGFMGCIAAPFMTESFTGLALLLLVWGGIVGSLYPLGLAHLGARYGGPELATANAAFVMLYSLGMLAGPPLLGEAMDYWNPHGLFGGMAMIFAAYIAVVAVRAWRERRTGLPV